MLKGMGFELVNVEGSHHKFRSSSGKVIIVPLHGNRQIPIGTLQDIVKKQLEMTADEFAKKLSE